MPERLLASVSKIGMSVSMVILLAGARPMVQFVTFDSRRAVAFRRLVVLFPYVLAVF